MTPFLKALGGMFASKKALAVLAFLAIDMSGGTSH